MACARMALRSPDLVSVIDIALADCATTTALRIRISSFEGASGRCRGLRVDLQRSASWRHMPQSTTRSTSSDIY